MSLESPSNPQKKEDAMQQVTSIELQKITDIVPGQVLNVFGGPLKVTDKVSDRNGGYLVNGVDAHGNKGSVTYDRDSVYGNEEVEVILSGPELDEFTAKKS